MGQSNVVRFKAAGGSTPASREWLQVGADDARAAREVRVRDGEWNRRWTSVLLSLPFLLAAKCNYEAGDLTTATVSNGADCFALPINEEADIYVPGGGISLSGAPDPTFIDVTGPCTGDLNLALRDHDPWTKFFWAGDDRLDERTADCVGGQFTVQFRIWCEGSLLSQPKVTGPDAGSGEDDAEIYVDDLDGPSLIPTGDGWWNFHCVSSDFDAENTTSCL